MSNKPTQPDGDRVKEVLEQQLSAIRLRLDRAVLPYAAGSGTWTAEEIKELESAVTQLEMTLAKHKSKYDA
jgi:hypothetical protein